MDIDRRSACDRCRGQKLRCVGLGNTVIDRQSGDFRNQTPCDRCRKAQVECYIARSTSHRRGTDARHPRYQGKSSARSYPSTEHPRPSISSEPATCLDSSNSLGVYSDFKSPEWPVICPDDEAWCGNIDLDMPSTMPFPQTPSFSGLGSSTLPTLRANVSQDNRFDRVLEGLLSEGRSTRSRDCSTDSDMTACSHPSGTGGDPESISQYLKGLAELNSTLLQSRANRHGAGHSDLGKSQPLPTRTGSSVPLSIGWTLTHCQQFLNMLQNLQRHVSSRPGHDTWSHARLEDTIDLSATPPSPAPLHQTPPRVSTLDTPILFSILSCYAYILEEYERLFSYILKSVIQPVPQIPATLIGISLDGFKLDGNNTLQMEFLLYISSNMLEKIETILVGSSQGTTAVPNQGLLGYKMMACLESLYDHDDVSTDDGADNREVRAITLIRKIQAALKNLGK